MSATSATQIRLLPWDSEFFGLQIAKTLSPCLQPHEIDQAVRECADAGVKCLYCELDPAAMETVNRAQELGFRFMEMRMILQHDLRQAPDGALAAEGAAALSMDSCPQEDDLPCLEEIARSIAPLSRFAVDCRFGGEASRRLYQRWLHNSLQDSAVTFLVARLEGRPAGFATLKSGSQAMHLELIGVAPAVRGQGTGAQLCQFVVSAAAAAGAAKVEVVTQGRNVAAVRLYERAGFRLAKVAYYFHKWFE